jgi:protein-tyrosine-phosphatase
VISSPRKIVFVCTGNICRSAMAELLLRHLAAKRGLDLTAASCGTAAESWYEVPEAARRLLAAEGVPAFEHKPRLATRETLREADLILAMTQEHLDHIVERFPEFAGRTRLFREQAGFGEQDVEDPMGRPDEAFAACLAVLKEGLEALLRTGFRDPQPR